MKKKKKTIECLEKLVNFAKSLPMFCVVYDIKAKNKDIEEYIIENISKTDWNGTPLPEDVIHKEIQERLKQFHNGEGYNQAGISTFKMSQCMTVQDINFSKIYDIVAGKSNDMPKNYAFVGNLRLMDFKNF